MSAGERGVLKKLFPGRMKTLKLENKHHKRISGAMESLKDHLKEEYHRSMFVTNGGYLAPGVLLSAATLVAAALTGGGRRAGPMIFLVLWMTPWTAVTLALWSARRFLMAGVFTLFLLGAAAGFVKMTSPIFIAVLIVLAGVNVLFYHLLKAPTNLGRRIMDRIEGFKMYLETAEEHRLEKLHPPEKTPELFEKYLPYALALGVDQQWSEKFSDVLEKAAARGYRPAWYTGTHWNASYPGRFASGLGSSLAGAVSSAATAPGSSSGFGGGGSSGGGGGGGGGGGW